MRKIIINPRIFLCILLALFITLHPSQLSANDNPWQIEEDEEIVIGTVIEVNVAEIKIRKGIEDFSYTPSESIVTALMGTCSGHLLPLSDFPLNIEVELYIDRENKVKSMRNKQIYVPANEGTVLNGWGHNASLSPDELFYSLYNWETGLMLYNSTNTTSPVFLSPLSVFSWNCKSEIAVSQTDDILILDPKNGRSSILALPKLQDDDCSRFITSISWNHNGEKLFYTALEDYSYTDSNMFKLAILDRTGRILGSTIIANLDSAAWLSENLILYTSYDDLYVGNGKIMLWNYETGKTSEFLSAENKCYSNLTYNYELAFLAYTETTLMSESIYVLNTKDNISKELYKSPFPIKNLQWSNNGELFFWDEYNNCIFKVPIANEVIAAIPLRTGYLPEEGVRNSYIYFLAEAIEEPQQVFFVNKTNQTDNLN